MLFAARNAILYTLGTPSSMGRWARRRYRPHVRTLGGDGVPRREHSRAARGVRGRHRRRGRVRRGDRARRPRRAGRREHVREVASRGGGIDVSFNFTSREDKQGTPLIELTVEDFTRGPNTALTSHFVTARATARHIVEQGSGVIPSVTSYTARAPSAGMGNTGPPDAAVELFMRTWQPRSAHTASASSEDCQRHLRARPRLTAPRARRSEGRSVTKCPDPPTSPARRTRCGTPVQGEETRGVEPVTDVWLIRNSVTTVRLAAVRSPLAAPVFSGASIPSGGSAHRSAPARSSGTRG
jgi:hypothetical protein